jgi:hypothetical protein
VRLTGDSPPTEKELEEIFAGIKGPAPEPTQPTGATREMPEDSFLQKAGQAARGVAIGAYQTPLGQVTLKGAGALTGAGDEYAKKVREYKPETAVEESAMGFARPVQSMIPAAALGGLAPKLGAGALGKLATGKRIASSALAGGLGATPQALESATEGEFEDAGISLLAGTAGGAAFGVGQKALAATAKRLLGGAIKPKMFFQKKDIDMGTISKHKLGGTMKGIRENAQKKIASMGEELNTVLEKAGKNKFDGNTILDMAEYEIKKGATAGKGALSAVDELKAIEAYRGRIAQYAAQFGKKVDQLTIKDLNAIRMDIGKDTYATATQGMSIQDRQAVKATQKAANKIYGNIKDVIGAAVKDPRYKQLNSDMSEIIKVDGAISDAVHREARKYLLGPLEIGGAGLGMISGLTGDKDPMTSAKHIGAGIAIPMALRSTVPGSLMGAAARGMGTGGAGAVGGAAATTAKKMFRGISRRDEED